MIRSLFILLGIIALIALSIGFTGDAGQASLTWLGYRVDTSATAAVIGIGVLAFLAVAFWQLVVWLARSPQRAERKRAATRRRQGEDILTKGFLYVASGDGAEARRAALKAVDAHDNVVLVRILAAQAAETAGDEAATRAACQAMLGVPQLKLAGLRGLTQLALATGDRPEARRLAADAYNQPKPPMWAFKTLFEAHIGAGEWAEALDLVEGALARKLVSPVFCERARAALMVASAAQLETSADAQMREQALDYAVRAAKLQPMFTPAAVIAARLLAASNKMSRAEDVLETAFAAAPHPALWLAYRDLIGDETPRERARRLQGLIDRNPSHRESLILQVERAILNGDRDEIDLAITALGPELTEERLTRRTAGLMAKASVARGEPDAARDWVLRAGLLRAEAEWSDLDAEGRAFAYSPTEWWAVVTTWAEHGTLAHPRRERADGGLPDVPDLPTRYVPSMPFVKSAARKAPVLEDATREAAAPDTPPDAVGALEDDFYETGGYESAITGQVPDESAPPAEPETPPVAKPRARRAKPADKA